VLLDRPVEIARVIRRMCGGSQSFLIRGSDGACYVAKFANNPQGNRTLINECIAGHLLSVLGVKTPDLTILSLGNACVGRDELYFSTSRREPIVSGLHLGSKCPVDPEAVTIFDFLPRTLYSRVGNLDDIGVVFAFDQWVAHIDKRQFIFARQPNSKKLSTPNVAQGVLLTAWAIDNGMCFGKNWTFSEGGSYTFHHPFDIYSYCNLEESAGRGAGLIRSLPNSELYKACQNIPQDWFLAGDEVALKAMLEVLQRRRQGLETSIRFHLSGVRETLVS
jgi:HipA-like protein